MSGQSKIMSTVIAAFASVLMSSIAVGAAIGPAHSVDQVQVRTYA
ncbi:MAG: hypothetical protein ABIO43_01470 [Sphingomicrobium sp.]